MEQLAGVSAGAVAPPRVAAAGPVAGGVWHPEGQPGGAASVGAGVGGAARRGAEQGAEFQAIRRGWCLGEEGFRKELLAQMSERLGAEHYGEERAETEAAKAERDRLAAML